jgi:hypothetical protein
VSAQFSDVPEDMDFDEDESDDEEAPDLVPAAEDRPSKRQRQG